MLKIGDFSKLSRISIRMLRHYDEIGLLIPKETDQFSSYRYYGEDQLPIAGQIQALKGMGFSLHSIKDILGDNNDPKEFEKLLLLRKKELETQAEETEQKLRILDSTIEWIRKDGKSMDYNVSLKTLPARYVASVRQIIPTYQEEALLWNLFKNETAPLNIRIATPCYGLAIYHDEGNLKMQKGCRNNNC